ncbi:hypothetical protein BRC74_07145 [Halobacteriales archaeon QH_7_68_42]|nr:MAG: hypothetical protein BRC74_07145 [Halobacteriales archaeon QH_7_68_42]
MVEDRVTDGERVVVDADPDAEPAPDGTLAFRVAVDGDRVGEVRIYPDGAEIRVEDASDGSENGSLDTGRLVEATRGDGLRAETTDDGVVVRIEYGAAVKQAVDALVAGVDT